MANGDKVKDITYAVAKGLVSSIPVAGAVVSELLGAIIAPPLEKRREEWMNDVGERLKKLEEDEGLDLNSLSTNEQFIDVVLQATTLALKTSQEEKLLAFKNIISNAAKDENPDSARVHIFLSLVDSFTEWHLRILNLINNPRKWFEERNIKVPSYMMSSISRLIKDAFTDLSNEDDLIDLIWEDLKRAGFHRSGDVKTSMSGDGILSKRTTELAIEFLAFISAN